MRKRVAVLPTPEHLRVSMWRDEGKSSQVLLE